MPVEDHFKNVVMAMVAKMSVKAPKPFANPKKVLKRNDWAGVHNLTDSTDREEMVSIRQHAVLVDEHGRDAP
jgi:hypothetical protein